MATIPVTPGFRSIALYGAAYSTTGNVNIKVTLTSRNEVVFNGTVSTQPRVIPKFGEIDVEPYQLLFWKASDTAPISDNPENHGIIKIEVTGGDLIFAWAGSNMYRIWKSGEYRPWEKVRTFIDNKGKHEALLNGVPYDNNREASGIPEGPDYYAWHYIVRDNQRLEVVLTGKKVPWPMPGYRFPTDPNDKIYRRGLDDNTATRYLYRPYAEPDTVNYPGVVLSDGGWKIPSYAEPVPPGYPGNVNPEWLYIVPDVARIPTTEVNGAMGGQFDPVPTTPVVNNPVVFTISIDIDNNDEPDIVYVANKTGATITVDKGEQISVAMKKVGQLDILTIDVDNDDKADIIITRNTDGTLNIQVDQDLDIDVKLN